MKNIEGSAEKVTVSGSHLRVENRAFILLGGEIQYFRLPLGTWRDRLRQARAGGLNTVTSYMPWYWHEPGEGRFDLEGKTLPERNLRLFLDLVAESGLKLVARPGPFVNSELRLGGFPGWLFRDHPETLSRRSDGGVVTGRPVPAEGEPSYRAFARRWYRAVVPLLAEYDINHGGPMILFQPDNELSAAWSYGLLNSLYDPAVLARRWPDWLSARYGNDPAAAGASHGRRYERFEEALPPLAWPASEEERALCLDWMDFKRWFFADWGATLSAWAREDGVMVPVVFNEPVAGYYGHGDHAGFGAVLKERGQAGFTACHTYSDRVMDLDGLTSPALGIELVRSSPWGGPAMSLEINSEWHVQRLCRPEINLPSLLRLGLGRGLSGFVVYPYATGLAPEEDTVSGPLYWERTCLDAAGHPTENNRSVRNFCEYAVRWQAELASAQPARGLALAYTPGLRLLDFLGPPRPGKESAATPAEPGGDRFDAEPVMAAAAPAPGRSGHDWLDGYEGVSRQTMPPEAGIWHRTREAALLLNRLNAAWEMIDLANPPPEPGRIPLIVPCAGVLEREAIDYLTAHLDRGGALLFFPAIPVRDLRGQSDDRLAARLGVRAGDPVRPAGGRPLDYGARPLRLDGGGECLVDGWIRPHFFPRNSEIIASIAGKPVAARLPGGRVIVAGLDMSFTSTACLGLWKTLIGKLPGAGPSLRVDGNWLHGLLRPGREASFLTLINVSGRHGASRVAVRIPGKRSLSFGVELKPLAARCLVFDVRLRDGSKMLYSSSEVTPTNRRRNRFRLAGCPGTRGEIAFDRPRRVLLDGRQTATGERRGRHVLGYTHGDSPLDLRL